MAKQEFPINTGYPFLDFVLFMFSTMIFVGLMFLCFVLYAREHVKEIEKGKEVGKKNGFSKALAIGPYGFFKRK